MRNYRIVKDNYLGYEAQVRYSWFPFVWFQMNDFYWINTWPTVEHALHFIEQNKTKKYKSRFHHNNNSSEHGEFEKEVKLLMYHPKNLYPEIVWVDSTIAQKIMRKEPVTARGL